MKTRENSANANAQTAAGNSARAPQPRRQTQSAPEVVFLLAQDKPARGLTKVPLSRTRSIYVLPDAALTRSDLSKVGVVTNKNGQSFVVFTFNTQGARKLADVSRRNIGQSFALVVNGTLEAVPRISAPMTDGVLGVPFANRQTAENVASAVIGRPASRTSR